MKIPKTFPFWYLLSFGITVGLLTALSSAAGTTTTLLGLMFALVGGSLVSWFRPPAISVRQMIWLVRSINGFSVGIVVGLLLGMTAKGIDQAWITPYLVKSAPEYQAAETARKAEQQRRQKWDDLLYGLAVTGEYDDFKAVAVALAASESRIASLPVPSDSNSVRSPSIFHTQSDGPDEVLGWSKSLDQRDGRQDPTISRTRLSELLYVLSQSKTSDDLPAKIASRLRLHANNLKVLDANDEPVPDLPSHDEAFGGGQGSTRRFIEFLKTVDSSTETP